MLTIFYPFKFKTDLYVPVPFSKGEMSITGGACFPKDLDITVKTKYKCQTEESLEIGSTWEI